MRHHRIISRSVALVSTAAIVTSLALSRSSQLVVVTIVAVAMLWGALPQAIDALLGEDRVEPPASSRPGSFTVVIHLGGQPAAISRASVLAASAAVPTVVAAADAALVERIGPLPCPVVLGATIEEAINAAVAPIETDAVLLLSSGSFPDVEGAARVAGLVRDGFGSVVGLSRSFNHDGFSPLVRGRLGRRLRASARAAGLELWEPNATVVETALLHTTPLCPGRPWGAVLRAAHARGRLACHCGTTVSVTAEPVDARSYWPASVWRRRRAVADLTDAALTTRGRARWLATGLLLRELDGVVLTVWLMSPWLLTAQRTAAFGCPLPVLVLIVAVPAVLRWAAQRIAHGVRLHPLEDMLAMAFDAPGSVLAVPTAFSRRVRPTHLRLPGQPLVVAGAVFAALTLIPLLGGGTTARRSGAVGLALTELGLLWLLAMRVMFQRNWMRRTYRIRSQLAVTTDDRTLHTADVSPSGVSVEGPLDAALGSVVPLEVSLSDGTTLHASGTVESRRRRGAVAVTGLSIDVAAIDQTRWIAQLSRSAAVAWKDHAPVTAAEPAPTARLPRWGQRAIAAAIALISIAAAGTLVLALLGYRPLIVRSGSMEPALHVGDVVLVEDVHADELAVGDVTTVSDPAEVNDSLTHRVVAIGTADGQVTLTTRGDANSTTETFQFSSTAIVGRVVGRLPAVGNVVAWAGNGWVRGGAAVVGIGTASAVIAARRRNRKRPYPSGDDGLAGVGAGGDAGRSVRL